MSDTKELQVSNQNTEIQKIIGGDPNILFQKPDLLKPLVSHIKSEISAFDYDLDTDKGRKAVTALANKVTKTKTAIEKAGKEINREILKQRDANNKFVASAVDELVPLRDLARKPLTEWEAAEKEKDDRRQAVLVEIKTLGACGLRDTSDQILERLDKLKAMNLAEMDMGDYLSSAEERLEHAIKFLKSTWMRVKQTEDDAAELAELRAKQEADRKELERLRAQQASQDTQKDEKATEERSETKAAPMISASTSNTNYDVGDPDANGSTDDPRLDEIIAALATDGNLGLPDAERIGEMLFKGEIPHMGLV